MGEKRAEPHLAEGGLWRGNVAVQTGFLDLLPEPWDGDSGVFSGHPTMTSKPAKGW